MAGPQDIVLRAPNRACFLAKAAPASRLARIPYFGPLFTYDLGKSPMWRLTITYLGFEDEPGVYTKEMKPPDDTWVVDIGLMIRGEFVGSGDDLMIDIHKTALEEKVQTSTTKIFLERGGDAQLYVHNQTIYSFEVQDSSKMMVSWVVALATGLIMLGVGYVLGKN